VQKKDLYFSLALWGEQYIQTFLDYCLPTQLASGNLPAAVDKMSAVYRIFTPAEDIQYFEGHWAIERLREILPTEIIPVEISASEGIHERVSEYHKAVVRDARDEARWLVFLTPDNFWADGSFGHMADLLSANDPDVLVVTILRSDADKMEPEIQRMTSNAPELPISISPRKLVSLSIRNLFSLSKLMVWGPAQKSSDLPHHLYFPASDVDYVARGFHSHPMAIRLHSKIEVQSTLDTEFLSAACKNLDRIYVVPDSDLMFACDLTEPDKPVMGAVAGPLNAGNVWRWAELEANPIHRKVFETNVLLRGSEGDGVSWDNVRSLADSIGGDVIRRLNAPASEFFKTEPAIVHSRLVRFLRDSGMNEIQIRRYWARTVYIWDSVVRLFHRKNKRRDKRLWNESNKSARTEPLWRRLVGTFIRAIGRSHSGVLKMPKPYKIYFCTVVQNSFQLESFLRAALPSLLASGNIPEIAENSKSFYRIITLPEFEPIIRGHTTFNALRKVVPAELTVFGASAGYEPEGVTQERFLKLAFQEALIVAEWMILLAPDIVWSNSSMRGMREQFGNKKIDVFCSLVLPTNGVGMENDLQRASASEDQIDISSRDLVNMSLSHLHPKVRAHNSWGTGLATDQPATIIFDMAPAHAFVRTFQPEVVALRLQENFPQEMAPSSPMFLQEIYSRSAKISVVENSDIVYCCRLANIETYFASEINGPLTSYNIWKWAERHTRTYQHELFGQLIWLRGDEIISPNFNEIKDKANLLRGEVDWRLNTNLESIRNSEPEIVRSRLHQYLRARGKSVSQVVRLVAVFEYGLLRLFLIKDGVRGLFKRPRRIKREK